MRLFPQILILNQDINMNNPTYKIHGLERRKLKKELAELKSFVKNFWHYHQLDKDMYAIYGCDDSKLLRDEEAQIKLDNTEIKIKQLEERLSVLFQ